MPKWHDAMHAEGPEIVIPGRRRGCAELRIGPGGALVRASDVVAELVWADYGKRSGWTVGSPGGSGVAVWVSGRYVPQTEAVRRAVRTIGNEMQQMSGTTEHRSIPVNNSATVGAAAAECATLAALCLLLAGRPALRTRLADDGVATRLVADIQQGALEEPAPGGVRRRTLEVASAMKQLGLTHEIGGRPVPGDPLVPFRQAIDGVLAYLAHDPYVTNMHFDRAVVAEIVGLRYTAVTPWPFQALTGS